MSGRDMYDVDDFLARANPPPSAPVGVERNYCPCMEESCPKCYAQQPAAVDEAMVERACDAYLQEAKRQGFNPSDAWARSQQAKDWMRAALSAALAAQQGGSTNE